MKRIQFLLVSAFIIPCCIFSQPRTKPGKLLTDKTFNYVFNKAFSKFATGQQNMPTNYVSYDPTNSKFLLNGFLGLKDSTSKRPQFLSFSISGGLIGGNATTLFSEKKLNSDVNIDLKYHFLFRNKTIMFFKEDREKLERKLDVIWRDSVLQKNKFDYAVSNEWIQKQKDVLDWKITSLQSEYATLNLAYDSVKTFHKARIETKIKASTSQTEIKQLRDSLKIFGDSALALVKKINENVNERFVTQSQLDSINKVSASVKELTKEFGMNLSKATDAKKMSAELEAKLNAYRYNWFSATVAFNKRKFYTYYDSLPFKDRLTKNTLDAFNLGLEWNFLYQGLLVNKTHYFNIGFLNRRYNNLDGLPTTDVDQEIETSSNDTTRTISKKYSAFTDVIDDFRSWFLYSNYYFFWGKWYKTGIHIFPELELRNNKKEIFNAGIGFIVSFKNEEKDKSVLNVEAYSKFLDIRNQLQTNDKFFERLEIGIRAGLPINPF